MAILELENISVSTSAQNMAATPEPGIPQIEEKHKKLTHSRHFKFKFQVFWQKQILGQPSVHFIPQPPKNDVFYLKNTESQSYSRYRNISQYKYNKLWKVDMAAWRTQHTPTLSSSHCTQTHTLKRQEEQHNCKNCKYGSGYVCKRIYGWGSIYGLTLCQHHVVSHKPHGNETTRLLGTNGLSLCQHYVVSHKPHGNDTTRPPGDKISAI